MSLIITAGLLVLGDHAARLEADESIDLFLLNRSWSGEYCFDGMLHLLKFHMIEPLPDSLSRVSPFHLEARFRKQESPERFRFYFASSPGGQYYFYYHDSNMSENGVYYEKDFSTSKLIDFSALRPESEIKFEVFSRGRELTVEFNDEPFSIRLSEKIDHLTLNILNWPFFAHSLLIDHIEINRIEQDGDSLTFSTMKRWDFESPPIFLDLPHLLGLQRHSIQSIIFAFLFLVLVSILADISENLLLRYLFADRQSFSGFEFLLLPARLMLLFILRSAFALPVLSLLLAVTLVILLKTIPLSRPVEDSPRTVPALAVALLQCAAYPVFRLFCPYPDFPLFPALTMVPWFMWYALYAVRSGSGGKTYATLLTLMIPIVLAGAVELGLRGNRFAGLKLDYRQRVANLHWDFEKRTDLFGGPAEKETVVIRDRVYSVRKPEGRTRIACLGSSSTWGVGASKNNRYPDQLERKLRKKAGIDLEVINAGIIPGAPFSMLLVYLEGVLVKLDPDLVIVYFGDNHDIIGLLEYYDSLRNIVEDNPYIDSNEKMWAAMQLKTRTPLLVNGFLALSDTRCFVALNLFTRWTREQISASPPENDLFGTRRVVIDSTVERLVDACLNNGIKVLLIPEITLSDVSTENRSHLYYDIFKTLFLRNSTNGVYYLDLLSFFENTLKALPPHEEKTAVLIDEMHMSDYGYSLLAGRIADTILNEGIIEPSR